MGEVFGPKLLFPDAGIPVSQIRKSFTQIPEETFRRVIADIDDNHNGTLDLNEVLTNLAEESQQTYAWRVVPEEAATKSEHHDLCNFSAEIIYAPEPSRPCADLQREITEKKWEKLQSRVALFRDSLVDFFSRFETIRSAKIADRIPAKIVNLSDEIFKLSIEDLPELRLPKPPKPSPQKKPAATFPFISPLHHSLPFE